MKKSSTSYIRFNTRGERGHLTKDEAMLIRRLCAEGRRLRQTVRPDADLVDAMCALDVSFGRRYVTNVALRVFNYAASRGVS